MEDIFKKWRYSVGDIILSFGNVEFFSHSLFREICPDKNVPPNFPDRAKKLRNELRRSPQKLKHALQIAELLDRALDLFVRRNHVAHNTVSLQIYQSLKSREFASTLAIYDEKKHNEGTSCLMTYESLVKLQIDIRILVKELSIFMHD